MRERLGMKMELTLLLIFALLLTGCAFRFPGTTDPVIKIGLVAPFEGRYRARGYEVLYAVKLAIRQWNDTRGVGRYRVALVALDDGGDPTQAVDQVREMAVDPVVLGVVGHFAGATTRVAAPEYAAQELTLIATGTGAEGITAGGWVVRFGPSNEMVGEKAARLAVESLGAARLAVLRGENSLSEAFVAAVRRRDAQVVFDAAADDVQREGEWTFRLAEAAPDAAFVSSGVIEGAEAIRLAREAGVEVPFVGGPALGDRLLVQIGGDAAEGVAYVAAAPAGVDLQNTESFLAAYRALAGHAPGPRATLAYEATRFLLAAIDRASQGAVRPPSRQEVWAQLTTGSQHRGLIGTLSWNSRGEPEDWPMAIYRIESGAYPGRWLH